MPEQFLHRANVVPVFEQVGRKRVTHRVRADAFRDASRPRGLGHRLLDNPSRFPRFFVSGNIGRQPDNSCTRASRPYWDVASGRSAHVAESARWPDVSGPGDRPALLPCGSHSDTGVMRGHWGAEELRRVETRRFGFTPMQAEQIRRSVSLASVHAQEER